MDDNLRLEVLEVENSNLKNQLAYLRSEFKSINIKLTTMKKSNLSLKEKVKCSETEEVTNEDLKVRLGRIEELEKDNESLRLNEKKNFEIDKSFEEKIAQHESEIAACRDKDE